MDAPKPAKVFSLSDFGKKQEKQPQIVQVKKTTGKKTDRNNGLIFVDPMKEIDIEHIHKHVMSLYEDILNQIQSVDDTLIKLQLQTAETIEEKIIAESRIATLELKLNQLTFEAQRYQGYEEEAESLMDQYARIVPSSRMRVVGTEEVVVDSELYNEFRIVTSEFINLAQRYTTNIQIISQQTNVEKCKKCHGNQVLVGTKIHCSSCGALSSLKEGSGSANSIKNEYYRSETFEEHMAQYQGRQKKPIPPEVFQKIVEHCDTNHIDPSTLTKPQILRILKRYKMSEHYNAVNSIAHSLTGAPLPNIRHLERKLLERHRLLEQEYVFIRDEEGRSNFLYGWYVLRAFLMMEGYPSHKDDFLALTTRDALVDHDKVMTLLCERIRDKQKTDSSIEGNWQFGGLA